MKLYHGSPTCGLTSLKIGNDTKQGEGIYLTDCIEQARYFGKYGCVYEVILESPSILDFSSLEFAEIFHELSCDHNVSLEIEALSNGSGNFPLLMKLIPEDKREEIIQKISKYNVHKIKSLGYRGYFNYIVKDESIVKIKSFQEI